MVMLTVKITQRLHLWAEFDGAFYRPHSTQALTFRLKCEHYGNVDGEYFYLTKHFSAVFYYALRFHFKGRESLPENGSSERIFIARSAFNADLFWFISLKKFEINFNFKQQIAAHALSLSLCILHFLIIKYFSIIFLY